MTEDRDIGVIVLAALTWKYGEVFVDDNEIEYHHVDIAMDDFFNFGYLALEVYHDEIKKVTHYRVRKTN